MNSFEKKALEYVHNAAGNATVAVFDDDHEPIGPRLRQAIAPYVVVDERGRLHLNDDGRAALRGPRGEESDEH